MKRKLVTYIGNNPTPYRIPVFNAVGGTPDFRFVVLFSTPREPIRDWDLPAMTHEHSFMVSRYFAFRKEFVHVNLDVFTQLYRLQPDLIIISGFNPTCVFAFLYSLWSGCKLGLMIDGTPESEGHLSIAHRLLRRLVCPRLSLFLGPSDQTLKLFDSFGAQPDQKFKSHLCANNAAFRAAAPGTATFDLMFCGRFAEGKNPEFAIEVAELLSHRLNRTVSLLMVGSGPLDEVVRQHASRAKGVLCEFPGFATQSQLPELYRKAKVFLFPTSVDTWGVVANEACASGLPVVVSPHAGVVGELVIDGCNGYVRPLDAASWVNAIAPLLTQPELYATMAAKSLELVNSYTYDHAAQSTIEGIRSTLGLQQH